MTAKTDDQKAELLPWAMIAKGSFGLLFLIGSTLLVTMYDSSIKDGATIQSQGEAIEELEGQLTDVWGKYNEQLVEITDLKVALAEKGTDIQEVKTIIAEKWAEFYKAEYESDKCK